ncbi:MAG TPA: 4-alpha-glucanotransferase [Verrucomicrobiae bacterium]|nr:4-alpha-glucanotransferase [Verrucomicrobiae bacterium]
MKIPPFPSDYRASGLLLHATSLPSPYGIGDLGSPAFSWVNRLHDAGQQWWQSLPVGPTGYGNSPYQSLSSFAGNSLLISPEGLILDGLLKPAECEKRFASGAVDFEAVIAFKRRLLETAWARFHRGERRDLRPAYQEFCFAHASWLEDYALFRALKARYNGAQYLAWPDELVQRQTGALLQAKRELADEVDRVCFSQFLLFRQADQLKEHAHSKGIGLIGDLPFFVSPDSSDVWANSELFLLNERRRPRFVAGVPPDYFSAQGQLWGNPVYNWDALRATGYRWWIDRLRALLSHADLVRLDHFRGFAAAWHLPAGAQTAQEGQWIPGPGASLFHAVQAAIGRLPFLAEDLGVITPDVKALRDDFRVPGTRVLQFAFDGHEDNPYLPGNFVSNTVVYTGTHDNATTRQWYEELPEDQRQNVCRYLPLTPDDGMGAAPGLLRLAWSSVAALAVAPVQDLLNLGREARMNVPGHAEGNWRWRCPDDILSSPRFRWLQDLTESTGRAYSRQSAGFCVPGGECAGAVSQ